jgi:hypothetical protein
MDANRKSSPEINQIQYYIPNVTNNYLGMEMYALREYPQAHF